MQVWAPEVAARRADAIGRLRSAEGPFVLVAPYLAAMQAVPPSLGTIRPLQLAAGIEMAPDRLAERLSELGYVRVDVVEHRGEFAVRGGVVDVFPGIARRPARLEYWGDEIERLRELVAATVEHGSLAEPGCGQAGGERRSRAGGGGTAGGN